MTETTEQTTPLLDWHREHGAKIVDFHGWQMPLVYGKVFDEVAATRQRVGLFDLSHMGRIHLRGEDRVAFLDHLFTGDVAQTKDGQVRYGFLCNETGGVIDDITIHPSIDYIMLVVNAANRSAVLEWLHGHAGDFEDLTIEDKTHTLGMCAVQGPRAVEIVDQLTSSPVRTLKYYTFRLVRILGHICLVARTGYTGEDGFELYFGRAFAVPIWEAIHTAAVHVGGVTAGLAARDALRLEAGMPLHGQELSPTITPIEAGLDRFVDFSKGEFVGRSRLYANAGGGVDKRLIALEMETDVIPRTGYHIVHEGAECGAVTSGGYSPTLGKAIGMGYVDTSLSRRGQSLQVRARGKLHPAIVVRRPFYRREKSQ